MTSISQYGANRRMLVEPSAAFIRPTNKSDTRVDIVLLASALFFQRFGLSVGRTSVLSVDIVVAALILAHQFARGRLFVQWDRLLWFLVLTLASTASLLVNFESRMLANYGLFLTMYFLCTLTRPSTPEQYKTTLEGFQFLVLILCYLSIGQFAAQFVMDGRKIITFFGLVPDFLLAGKNLSNTIGPITSGSSFIKSNGIFLAEPSNMSQIAAFGIIAEVLTFRRPRYLLPLGLGLLLAYSGTGITILLLFLPLASVANPRAQLPALLVGVFALGLMATGIINTSAFTSRVGEFDAYNASGFQRFISPFWMAAEHFDTASLQVLLFGNGPSTQDRLILRENWGNGAFGGTWFKLLYEYGLIAFLVFWCFLLSCLRKSKCSKLFIAAFLYCYVFTSNNLLNTSYLIIFVVLCTLSGSDSRGGRTDETSRGDSFAAIL